MDPDNGKMYGRQAFFDVSAFWDTTYSIEYRDQNFPGHIDHDSGKINFEDHVRTMFLP